MKRVIVICDGMADEPVSSLGGKTPLEYAHTPALDMLAEMGRCGSLQTVPEGFYPGSEVAILSILGYEPSSLPLGRGPLEASGLGISIPEGYTAMRYQIDGENMDIMDLKSRFKDCRFIPIAATKGICIAPSDDVATLGKLSDITFWSGDSYRKYSPLSSIHQTEDGTPLKTVIIGAVPLLRGIAIETGADWIKPEYATGTTHTDFKGKGEAAVSALDNYDLVIVHVEACDFASHALDVNGKIRSIENIDKYIISPLLDIAVTTESDLAIAVMSDHPSLCESGCHSSENSPFAYFHPGIKADKVKCFSEKSVRDGSLSKISDIYER